MGCGTILEQPIIHVQTVATNVPQKTLTGGQASRTLHHIKLSYVVKFRNPWKSNGTLSLDIDFVYVIYSKKMQHTSTMRLYKHNYTQLLKYNEVYDRHKSGNISSTIELTANNVDLIYPAKLFQLRISVVNMNLWKMFWQTG